MHVLMPVALGKKDDLECVFSICFIQNVKTAFEPGPGEIFHAL
jgi:hypothetical protein